MIDDIGRWTMLTLCFSLAHIRFADYHRSQLHIESASCRGTELGVHPRGKGKESIPVVLRDANTRRSAKEVYLRCITLMPG